MDPINLPTETDPFESPEDNKSRETPSPPSAHRRPVSPGKSFSDGEGTIQARQLDDDTNRQSWIDEFGREDFFSLKLPPHVKFPHKVRESARTLYNRHSRKLPRSVRVYRKGQTSSKDNDEGSASGDKIKQTKRSKKKHILASEQHVEDITLDFLYKPYSISGLIATVLSVFYYAVSRQSEVYDLRDNILSGSLACCLVLIVVGLLAFPNGPFIRPHPAFWRIVLTLNVIYLISLVWMLFLSLDQIRDIMHWLDPKLADMKREIDMVESYAQDCNNITPAKIYASFDIFAFAHWSGWVGKATLLRSYGLCWLISILWEMTEMVFTHLMPNFAECWWDSWLLDVTICNGFGIYCGIEIARFLEMRTYKWESIKSISTVSGKLERAVLQFTPHSWHPTTWIEPHSSPNRVFKLWIITMLFLLTELNTFFFKHFFVFNGHHVLCWGRHLFMCLLGAPSIRQYYVYCTDMTAKRLGTHAWCFIAAVLMESIVNFKFGFKTLSNTKLSYIFCWVLFVAVACAIALYIMAAWSELRQFLESDKRPAGQDIATDDQRQGDCKPNCNSNSEDDEDDDTYSSYFFRRNYVLDAMTDTTDTDGVDRTTYFPSAARLRKRIVKRIEEFRTKVD